MTNNTLTATQQALIEDLERNYGTATATDAVLAYSEAIAIGHTQDDALAVMAHHSGIWAAAFADALEDLS